MGSVVIALAVVISAAFLLWQLWDTDPMEERRAGARHTTTSRRRYTRY